MRYCASSHRLVCFELTLITSSIKLAVELGPHRVKSKSQNRGSAWPHATHDYSFIRSMVLPMYSKLRCFDMLVVRVLGPGQADIVLNSLRLNHEWFEYRSPQPLVQALAKSKRVELER